MTTVSGRLRARRLRIEQAGESGFTLIELLVVLLIIGILLAIAIPTFLSVTKSANNTAAQSNLQTALTGAKTYFEANNQSYSNIDAAAATVSNIKQVDTGLSFVSAAGSTAANVVSIGVYNTGGTIELTTFSPGTKDCWGILDVTSTQTSGTWTASATGPVGTYFGVKKATTSTTCNAASFQPVTISTTGFPSG